MKTYKIDISGITPYLENAKNEKELLNKITDKFGPKILKGRKINFIEWKEYSVKELIKDLSKFDKNRKVCIPSSGHLSIIKGICEIGVHRDHGTKEEKIICLENYVRSPNLN